MISVLSDGLGIYYIYLYVIIYICSSFIYKLYYNNDCVIE